MDKHQLGIKSVDNWVSIGRPPQEITYYLIDTEDPHAAILDFLKELSHKDENQYLPGMHESSKFAVADGHILMCQISQPIQEKYFNIKEIKIHYEFDTEALPIIELTVVYVFDYILWRYGSIEDNERAGI